MRLDASLWTPRLRVLLPFGKKKKGQFKGSSSPLQLTTTTTTVAKSMFRHGLPTSSLASRDPYAQYRRWRGLLPAITHSSTPKLNDFDYNTYRKPNPNTSTVHPHSFFPSRPPITFTRRTESQRKHLKRKIRYLHCNIPKSTPRPRCARFRLWYKEARKRRRQLRINAELSQQVT